MLNLEARVTQTGGKVELEGMPTIEAEAFQIRQLFQNLIGNALKFHKPDNAPCVKVGAEKNAEGFWVFTVADNGVGFDSKYAERVFKPFERLHGRSEFEGSGIGLAVCKKIVNRHGGEISVSSVLGEGSVFTFTLPEKQAVK